MTGTGTGRCDSCGSDEPVAALVAVRRVYVVPDEERAEVAGGDERWCDACRAHYPHQVIAG